VDRFFERQRRESMARIARFEARRKARRVALPVAAVFVAAAVLVGMRALQTPAPVAAGDEVDWLFAWDLPGDTADDPLVPFGRWPTSADEAQGHNGDEDSLLPPLPDFLTTDELASDLDSNDVT
jgi:hypothetical protein